MRAPQFVLRTRYSMYCRCPQRWRIATVATDTPPNLLPVQGLYMYMVRIIHVHVYACVFVWGKCTDQKPLNNQWSPYWLACLLACLCYVHVHVYICTVHIHVCINYMYVERSYRSIPSRILMAHTEIYREL